MSDNQPTELQLAWLQRITGLQLGDKALSEEEREQAMAVGGDEAAFEERRRQQAQELAVVRLELRKIKAQTQQVLSQKIASGPFEGKRFLDIEGTEDTEIDPEAAKLAASDPNGGIPQEVQQRVDTARQQVEALGQRLKSARLKAAGKATESPLFEEREIQAEFWTPLKLERIFPEALIPPEFSEAFQLNQGVVELYESVNDEKKIAGQLTAKPSLAKELLRTGKDLTQIAGDMASLIGGDGSKLAVDICKNIGELLGTTEAVYDELKNSDFATAGASALTLAGNLTCAVLGHFVPKATVDSVRQGFSAGSSAMLMGNAMWKFSRGEADLSQALMLMGSVIGSSLQAAAAHKGTSPQNADALLIAAKAAPTVFKALALGSDLPGLVRQGDYIGIVNRLGDLTKSTLAQLPGLDSADRQQLLGAVDVGTAALAMTIQLAVNARRQDLTTAFESLIDSIGLGLQGVLSAAGVDKTTTGLITNVYASSTSAGKAIKFLASKPPQVAEAMQAVSGTLKSALAASGNQTLSDWGAKVETAVVGLVQVAPINKLFEDVGPEAGIEELLKQLRSAPLDKISSLLPPLDLGTDTEAGSSKLEQAAASMQQAQDLEAKEQAEQEAQMLLDQSKLELNALSEAQKTGAEASNIEAMIAELQKQRLVIDIILKVSQGGAAFIATFIPALGAVAAGIKLAANLVTAGQRFQQLDAWLRAQGDFKAAQSPLSAAATNFVSNQGAQFAHYSAQAFFAAVQLSGEITSLTGLAAPVGKTIAAAASLGASIEQFIQRRKDFKEIKAAWKVTQAALRNPTDRALCRKAAQLNPTWAKFAMGWGAMVLKDPLARDALGACGLTEAALQAEDEREGALLVVKYLEAFYSDDQQLYLDSSEPAPKWMPAELDVTLIAWGNFSRKAGSEGGVLIENGSTLEGLLAALASVDDDVKRFADDYSQASDQFRNDYQQLSAAIPLKTAQEPPTPMPGTDELTQAIDLYKLKLLERQTLYLRIESAFAACKPTARPTTGQGKSQPEPDLQAVTAAIERMKKKAALGKSVATREANGIQQERQSLDTLLAELKRLDDKRRGIKPEAPKKKTDEKQPELQN